MADARPVDARPMAAVLMDTLAHWPIGSGFYSTGVAPIEAREMADTILATPQMQAIRDALYSMRPGGPNDDSAAQEGTWDWRHLAEHHPGVIAWTEQDRSQ